MRHLQLLILLALAATSSVVAKLPEITEIDKFRYDLVMLEQTLWHTQIDEQLNAIGTNQNAEVELIRAYRKFSDTLEERMPYDVTHGLDALQNLWIWARTYGELRPVYALYETFRRFQRLQTDPGRIPSPKQAWIDLAETVLHDPRASVPAALRNITGFVKNERLFYAALQEIIFEPCDVNQSPRQLLHNLYNSVTLIQIKGYSMIQFSLQLLNIYNNSGNFTAESEIMRNEFEDSARTTIEAVKSAMMKTNANLWKCDPKVYRTSSGDVVGDETYTELKQLLQAYIENEIDLSPSTSCFKNCDYYEYAKSNGCYKNGFCSKQQPCYGKVLKCQYIDSDMWICPAKRGSGRRYEYIEYENGRVFGRKMGCERGTTKVDSWWRYLFWHCSYCMCVCDDDGPNSDRYFNLREVVSDIESNSVITGLRFVKKNRVIHLQIQEGVLQPFGRIDEASLRWKPVDDYKITDRNVRSGQDYHTMAWEKRDLDLDDLKAPENHVLTGVRFRVIGTHLNFEIQGTPFNFSTGKLIEADHRSFWNSNDFPPVYRTKLNIYRPDVPIRTILPSLPDSQVDQFVEFTNTDFDRDAGQTTVPFIDTQPVTPALITPLSGAGIYHKGQPNFGGFVAPRIITYDFSNHIEAVFPEPEDIHREQLKIVSIN